MPTFLPLLPTTAITCWLPGQSASVVSCSFRLWLLLPSRRHERRGEVAPPIPPRNLQPRHNQDRLQRRKRRHPSPQRRRPRRGASSATTSILTCPKASPASWLTCAASRTTSARRENPASSSQWQPARHSCAIRAIALPSTSRQSMRPGSTRSKSGSRSWSESFSDAIISHRRTISSIGSRVHRLLQCHHGETIPLDDEGETACRLTQAEGRSNFRRGVLGIFRGWSMNAKYSTVTHSQGHP